MYVCIYICVYIYIYYTYIYIYVQDDNHMFESVSSRHQDKTESSATPCYKITRRLLLDRVVCYTWCSGLGCKNVELLAHTKALRCVYVFYTEVYIDVDTQLIQIHMHLTYT